MNTRFIAYEFIFHNASARKESTLVAIAQNPQSNTLKAWKTIKIGGEGGVAALKKITSREDVYVDDREGLGVPVYRRLRRIRSTKVPTEVDLVRLSPAKLGFTEPVRYRRFYQEALSRGFLGCPDEVAPHLRKQYEDQPYGEVLFVAASPGLFGIPSLFVVHRDRYDKHQAEFFTDTLGGGFASCYGREWLDLSDRFTAPIPLDDEFIFVKPR